MKGVVLILEKDPLTGRWTMGNSLEYIEGRLRDLEKEEVEINNLVEDDAMFDPRLVRIHEERLGLQTQLGYRCPFKLK